MCKFLVGDHYAASSRAAGEASLFVLSCVAVKQDEQPDIRADIVLTA